MLIKYNTWKNKHGGSIPRIFFLRVSPAKHSYAWLPRKCDRHTDTDYQTDIRTDRQADAGQSDPYVPLCFAGDTKNQYAPHNFLAGSINLRPFTVYFLKVNSPVLQYLILGMKMSIQGFYRPCLLDSPVMITIEQGRPSDNKQNDIISRQNTCIVNSTV